MKYDSLSEQCFLVQVFVYMRLILNVLGSVGKFKGG
jgi:hypothetical protein